jgi:hypothetical protein
MAFADFARIGLISASIYCSLPTWVPTASGVGRALLGKWMSVMQPTYHMMHLLPLTVTACDCEKAQACGV